MKSINWNTKRTILFGVLWAIPLFPVAQSKALSGIKCIDYFFDNASPITWEARGDTIIRISLLPDYEREKFNRQTDHWYFRIEANKGTRIRLIISKTSADIYNGRLAKTWWNFKNGVSCYISYDQQKWEPIKTAGLPDNELLVDFVTKSESVYIARLPVYSEKNLEILKNRINKHPLVEIIPIGHTVEKRRLEIIRVGNPDAKHAILIRARAHPWEPEGNWIIEGLISEFLKDNARSKKWKGQICYYILPVANKDGVFHGMTRFNVAGKDLNRDWLNDADKIHAPENYALMQFTSSLILKGNKPSFAIDFHNDNSGDIHLTSPKSGDDRYLEKMELFRQILTRQTWFSQKLVHQKQISGGGNMADGMYHKFGIDACIFEFNANFIEKLNKVPEVTDMMKMGAELNNVFFQYLTNNDK